MIKRFIILDNKGNFSFYSNLSNLAPGSRNIIINCSFKHR